jgi:hypothetical protein
MQSERWGGVRQRAWVNLFGVLGLSSLGGSHAPAGLAPKAPINAISVGNADRYLWMAWMSVQH